MDEKLWKMIILLQRFEVGRIVAGLLYHLRIVAIYHYFALEYERKHPTIQMKKAKKFFEEGQNRKRIEKCVGLLVDAKSREIFEKTITFRITHDYRDRPVYCKEDQYFPKDIVDLRKDEVFIDCGAYTGDTVAKFLKETKNRYKRIVAFEPDRINIKRLRKTAENIIIVQAAAWNCDTEVAFEDGNGSGSKVDKDGLGNIVRARAIDNIRACMDATFIKMDIEGSEYNALRGAERVIRRNKPTLAICIYHSDEDMLRIIELIHSWKLGYKLYVRHYGQRISETVLYAVQ